MKRIIHWFCVGLGLVLIGLSFIIGWPLHVILSFAALATIIMTFIQVGILGGIISITCVLIGLWVLHLLLDLLMLPLTAGAALLMGVGAND